MALQHQAGFPDETGGPRTEANSVEGLLRGQGAECYSLAVGMLGTPSGAAEVVGQVFGDSVRAGPAAQTRPRLLTEVHRLAVARLGDRPRRLDPLQAEMQVWNSIADSGVRAVLTEMPVLARRVVLLVYFSGYRVRELAEALDRTPDEVRAALCTAIAGLRRDPRTGRTP